MTTVKIECVCGQRFAFDAEPVNGRVDTTVNCPTCGADRTDDANAILFTQLPRPFVPVSSGTPITAAERALGIVERPQAEAEARAKISWGDSPEEVIKYLMLQRFSYAEASDLVGEMFKERVSAVRTAGIRKIVTGSGMMCVPVIAVLILLKIGFIFMKLLAFPVMIGLWGCWLVITGIVALIAPKMESGDVADQ